MKMRTNRITMFSTPNANSTKKNMNTENIVNIFFFGSTDCKIIELLAQVPLCLIFGHAQKQLPICKQ